MDSSQTGLNTDLNTDPNTPYNPLTAESTANVFPDLPTLLDGDIHEVATSLATDVQTECEGLYADIQSKLLAAVASCLAECDDAAGGCVGCLTARAETIAATVAPTINKCQAKIGKAAGERFAMTMGYLTDMGLPWPEPSAIDAVSKGVSPAAVLTIADKLDAAGIRPTVASDIGDKPIPTCPPGYSLVTGEDGTVYCYNPRDGHTTPAINPTAPPFVGPLPATPIFTPIPTPTTGGPGGVVTTPTTDTGGDSGQFQQCSEGSAVQTGGECFGEARPKQVWYVVLCGADGRFQLDTYQGWNPPLVDDASIIAHGDLETTVKPTESEVVAFGAKLCSDDATTPPPDDKPTVTPDDIPCSPSQLMTAYKTAQSPHQVFGPATAGLTGSTPEQQSSVSSFVTTAFTGPLGIVNDLFGLGSGTAAVVKTVVDSALEIAKGVLNNEIGDSSCKLTSFAAHAAGGAVLNFAGGWLGAMPEALVGTNKYLQNLSCQWSLPSAPELHSLYSRGMIDKDEWTAGIAANGHCIPWQELVRDITATRPNVMEAIAAYRREAIDVDQFKELMRFNGVISDDDMDTFRQVTKYVPGPSDIVTFMLRDVGDPQVVSDYQLEAEFEDKWQGQLKDWTTWQGIDESTMRKYWAAHWTWPSNEQLYVMLWRLRDPMILPGTSTTVEPVTADDVLRVLGINDVAPVWRERLAAIAYRKPMRREIGKMYEVGAIEADAIPGMFQDIGYTEDDAKTLKEYVVNDSAERRAKFQGLPTRALVIKLFKADGLTYQQATDLLNDAGVETDAIAGVLDNAEKERDAAVRAKLVTALRRRYLSGEYDTDQVIGKLQAYGVATDRLQEMVSVWGEEKSLKRREPTVAVLCQWAGLGYITGEEWMRRLANLGYDATDATRFMSACSTGNAEKLIKEAKKQARERAAQLKADSRCREAPKPYCAAKRMHTIAHVIKSTNGHVPTVTDTDTTSESSG